MNDFNLTTPAKPQLVPVRFEQAGPMLMAGLRETLNENFALQILELWQGFVPLSQDMSHRVDRTSYGLCMKEAPEGQAMYYMAACELSEFVNVPAQLSQVIIPSHTYAVFAHKTHVSKISQTVCKIFDDWLPGSHYQLVQQATNQLHHLERYTEAFDPRTGMGGMEILVPVIPV